MTSRLDATLAATSNDTFWADSVLPTLEAYIRIPNKSPNFDPEWEEHGQMDRAVALLEGWCREHATPGTTIEVVRLPGRTPVLLLECPATDGSDDGDTVLLYGHLDKQPEMTGWREGLSPWTPVRDGDKLYGRGGADDGYAVFASVGALRLLAEQGIPRKRCVILIEACEESGSFDLPHYIEALRDRIGRPSLVVCLDSGCGNYDQLWCTTSLRGNVVGTLTVELLREGVHSGNASGIVASSFRVARALIDRIEDAQTGAMLLPELHVEIPAERQSQAEAAAAALGAGTYDAFPFHEGVGPVSENPVDLVLGRTWRPFLAVTGAEGLPAIRDAGNVMRPVTAFKLSLRTPPTCDAGQALAALKAELERDPPYGARVRLHDAGGATGWSAPALQSWLEASLGDASRRYFGADAMYMGEGGTIPFMGMLGERFPEAQFLVTGVLGPASNAHGPNEFLHLPTARKLTCCVADVVAAHAQRG